MIKGELKADANDITHTFAIYGLEGYASNVPYTNGILLHFATLRYYGYLQMCIDSSTTEVSFRIKTGSSWGLWKKASLT
jgi:hypothetical protein